MVDYAVKADFPKKHFWTLSIWKGRDSMRQFVMVEPHVKAVKNLNKWARDYSAFTDWTGSNNSIDWEEAIIRLQNPTFYYNKRKT
jgi:hypothetical protein